MGEYINKSEIYRRYFDGGCGVVRMHVSDIDVIPAADVAPVVHGRWREIRSPYGVLEGWIHEECGREVKCAENYCPTCGAKMDID